MAIKNCYRGHPLHSFLIPSFSKKILPTDFKVTQVLTCKYAVPEKLAIQSVVTNVLKFDISLPKTVFETTIHTKFGHSWRPLNILTC
jgi:hypothetical protein